MNPECLVNKFSVVIFHDELLLRMPRDDLKAKELLIVNLPSSRF
jgi:hypothetical protein